MDMVGVAAYFDDRALKFITDTTEISAAYRALGSARGIHRIPRDLAGRRRS